MRFYRSFNSLTMTASRMAASKVQRTEHRNNINSQIIFSSAAMRAFASKLTLSIAYVGQTNTRSHWFPLKSARHKPYVFLSPINMDFVLTTFLSLLGRVVPVPGMGDSISEGVVEEFVKGRLFHVFFLLCFPLFLQLPESSSRPTKSLQGLRLTKSPSISPPQSLVLSRVTSPPKETPLRSEPTSTSSILMPQRDLLLQPRQLLQRQPSLRPQR